jgi:hypothetical protein
MIMAGWHGKKKDIGKTGIRKSFYIQLVFILLCFSCLKCGDKPETVPSTLTFIKPAYQNIRLEQFGDTLHFRLSKNTYNEIKSFNYFEDNGIPYLSFYDRRSESVCIYNFSNQHRVKKLYLKKVFSDQKMYKTSVYTKNFDSIFVTNNYSLYLIDSASNKKSSIDFFQRSEAMPFFENQVPVAIRNNKVFMGVRPYVSESSLNKIKEWRIVYEFDMQNNKKELYYGVPSIYQSNLYNDRFFAYGYCLNDKGNFVFSFPADSNIYETNLTDYHKAYYGKSRYQQSPILSFSNQELKEDDSRKPYVLRDSYGPLFFDSYNNRYLRVAWQKLTEEELANNVKRKQSIIIFDNNFRIIGESELDNKIYAPSLFFADKGTMYFRVNPEDENAVNFARLTYVGSQSPTPSLAIK